MTNKRIRQRDSAGGDLQNNMTSAISSIFKNGIVGDLDLKNCNESSIVEAGISISHVQYDYGYRQRNTVLPDIGAYQCSE